MENILQTNMLLQNMYNVYYCYWVYYKQTCYYNICILLLLSILQTNMLLQYMYIIVTVNIYNWGYNFVEYLILWFEIQEIWRTTINE